VRGRPNAAEESIVTAGFAPLAQCNLVQVAAGLAAVHERKLIHRDIKPSNIMVSLKEGNRVTAKIIDLGLSKTVSESPSQPAISMLGAFAGTPEFASPEQFAGVGVDIRSDLYSLGERTSALRRDLEQLSSDAGAQLLQALGVKGDEAELRSASDEFQGHCLALTLLGSYLTDAYNGDIRYRREVRIGSTGGANLLRTR
jgi:serine/threonine protein kinase